MSKQAFKRMRKHLNLPVNRDPLPAYAWPGGYPLFYLCRDGGVLCHKCMNKEIAEIDDSTRRKLRDGWEVRACDVHWEGEPMTCGHCNDEIESAYGPVEES